MTENPKLKVPEIVVPNAEPFKNDRLERQKSADVLTQLLKTEAGPLVLALDSPWGTGKTTFLRMWRQSLSNEGFQTILFNAWENDFSENALAALVSEVCGLIAEFRDAGKSRAEKAAAKLKGYGAKLIKAAIPVGLKIATAGCLKAEDFTEESLGEFVESLAKEAIEKYSADKTSIQEFRKELAKYVEDVQGKAAPAGEHRPLVFMIDELDRCRPDYAVQVLEKVKHLFSVPNVVFVLALDRAQLSHALCCVYGADMNTDGYLRRFLDLEYRLPEPDRVVYCEYLFAATGLDAFFEGRQRGCDEKASAFTVLTEVGQLFNFGLRDMEHAIRRFAIVCRTSSEQVLCASYTGFLVCLLIHKKDLYADYVAGRAESDALLKYMEAIPKGPQFIRMDSGVILKAFLQMADHNRDTLALLREYDAQREDEKLSEEKRQHADRMMAGLQLVQSEARSVRLGELREYVRNKIEMTENFS